MLEVIRHSCQGFTNGRHLQRFTDFSHNTEYLELYIKIIPLLSPAVAPLGSFNVKAAEKSVFLAEGCASNLISFCVCSSLTCTGMFAE